MRKQGGGSDFPAAPAPRGKGSREPGQDLTLTLWKRSLCVSRISSSVCFMRPTSALHRSMIWVRGAKSPTPTPFHPFHPSLPPPHFLQPQHPPPTLLTAPRAFWAFSWRLDPSSVWRRIFWGRGRRVIGPLLCGSGIQRGCSSEDPAWLGIWGFTGLGDQPHHSLSA